MRSTPKARTETEKRWLRVLSTLNEFQARLFVADKALDLGRGGIRWLSQLTGMSRTTITKAVQELHRGKEFRVPPEGGARRPGGGRKKLEQTDPRLRQDLRRMVEESTAGDPMSLLRWTRKSTRTMAQELNRWGHSLQADTVGRLLEDMDYSLQVNRKVKEGPQHPDGMGNFAISIGRCTHSGAVVTRSFRWMARSTTPSQHKSAFGLFDKPPDQTEKGPPIRKTAEAMAVSPRGGRKPSCQQMSAHMSAILRTLVVKKQLSSHNLVLNGSNKTGREWFPTHVCTMYLTFVRNCVIRSSVSTPAKRKALLASGALNPHPEAVRSPWFQIEFFDPYDFAQVKYEMLRAHSVDEDPVAEVCRQFGLSRESFYQIQQAFRELRFASLLPRMEGRRKR